MSIVDETTEKKLNDFSNTAYNTILPPHTDIFFDAVMLQDYELGCLLGMITTQAEYDYIISRLPEYQKAVTRDITEYFPALGFTYQDVITWKSDPQNVSKLVLSPHTALSIALSGILNIMISENGNREVKNKIRVWVRFDPSLPQVNILAELLKKSLNLETDYTVFVPVIGDYNMVPQSAYNAFSCMYVDDADTLNGKCGRFNIAICEHKCRNDFGVLARPQVTNPEFKDASDEAIDHGLEQTRQYMNFLCQFDYVDHVIHTKGVVNG